MSEAVFEMFEHVELVAGKRRFESIGEADEEMFLGCTGRRTRHDADGVIGLWPKPPTSKL